MCRGGEMADAPALGAGTRKGVEVRVLSSAPRRSRVTWCTIITSSMNCQEDERAYQMPAWIGVLRRTR